MKKVNLKDELIRERELRIGISPEVDLSLEAFQIINEEVYHEHEIRNRLKKSKGKSRPDLLQLLEPENLFIIEDIKSLCIKYRLRFLSTDAFKGQIPIEAISRIKELEKKHDTTLEEFKIVAPSKAFTLEDCDDDPLLFLKVEEDVYYLIHQWGKDLSAFRKVLFAPVRNFYTLIASVFVVAILTAIFTPVAINEMTVIKSETMIRISLFLIVFVSISSVLAYIGLAFFKNVSSLQWNSKFFKQHF